MGSQWSDDDQWSLCQLIHVDMTTILQFETEAIENMQMQLKDIKFSFLLFRNCSRHSTIGPTNQRGERTVGTKNVNSKLRRGIFFLLSFVSITMSSITWTRTRTHAHTHTHTSWCSLWNITGILLLLQCVIIGYQWFYLN